MGGNKYLGLPARALSQSHKRTPVVRGSLSGPSFEGISHLKRLDRTALENSQSILQERIACETNDSM